MSETTVKVGMKFHHLEVIAVKENSKSRKSWLVRCECGKEFIIPKTHLLGTPQRRPTRSCGCRQKARGGAVVKNKRLYGVWDQMNRRCYNKSSDNYGRYGGKGVTVCDEWRTDFVAFVDWANANGHSKELTLDRIDPSKPYSPDNCRWVDYYVQSQNRGMISRNRSGVNGVAYYEAHGYRANIRRGGIRKHLGTFKTLEEAADIRRKAEEHFEKYGTIENFQIPNRSK